LTIKLNLKEHHEDTKSTKFLSFAFLRALRGEYIVLLLHDVVSQIMTKTKKQEIKVFMSLKQK